MSVNQDVQKLIDDAVAAAHKTTVGYVNKNWKTPPVGSQWQIHDAKLAQARALLDPPVVPPPVTPPPTDWWASVQTTLPPISELFVPVSSEAGLAAALASLQPGQTIRATAPFVVTSTLRIAAKLSGPALVDLTGVTVSGGDLGGLLLFGAEHVWVQGGTYTSTRKGLHVQDTIDCRVHGFVVKDCGDHGVFVTSIDRDNVGVDLQGEISNCGLNLAYDPHAEPGSGLHGSYVGARYVNLCWTRASRFVLDVHDQPRGAACQIGGTIEDSFFAVRAARATFDAQTQTGGSAAQIWGEAHDIEVQVEATDCHGRAVDTNGLYSGAAGIRVTHGRATRCCLNPKLAGQDPFQPHPNVTFTDCVVVA